MAFTNYIQQIKDTDGTTHNLVDTSASHYVKGTQTASTNAWTGALPDGVTAYYDGLSIDYFLPYAGTSSGATLNLGGLGAKPVYTGNSPTSGAVTTHYPVRSVIHMTYIINSSVNSGNGAWVVSAYYDSNTVSQLRWDYSTIYAGTAGIFPYTLIMMNTSGNYESLVTSSSTGTSKEKNTVGFIPDTLLLYYASGTTASGNKISSSNYGVYEAYNAFDFRYSANISTTSLTVGKAVYLKGTMIDGLFYLADTWWTQTLPTSDDGFVYMYVGNTYNIYSASTDYRVDLAPYHPIYWYKNGALREYGGDANTIKGLSVSGTATAVTGLTKVTIGSASAGTAIAADDITAWTTNTPTTVVKKTVVTGGSTTNIPNVTSAGSAASVSYANGILTFTNGTIPTLGTAIAAYTSLTTGDSVTVTAGTAASLSYTARSIPNISVTSKDVASSTAASTATVLKN